MGAGNIASLIANPLFVMKVQMQTASQTTLRSIGLRGLYSGFMATLLNNVKLGIQFPFYDWLNRDLGYNVVTSALISKGVSNSIMYPLDLVRVKQRKYLSSDTMVDILRGIHHHDGVRGLYRGVLLYNYVSIPHFVIMMCGVEYLKKIEDN